MLQPWSEAFFNLRPRLVPPSGNGVFVPLPRTAVRFLRTPAQAPQEIPDMARVVLDRKVRLDYLGDPLQRPQIGGKTGGQRALPQDAH